jgi:hypothetical protein
MVTAQLPFGDVEPLSAIPHRAAALGARPPLSAVKLCRPPLSAVKLCRLHALLETGWSNRPADRPSSRQMLDDLHCLQIDIEAEASRGALETLHDMGRRTHLSIAGLLSYTTSHSTKSSPPKSNNSSLASSARDDASLRQSFDDSTMSATTDSDTISRVPSAPVLKARSDPLPGVRRLPATNPYVGSFHRGGKDVVEFQTGSVQKFDWRVRATARWVDL